MQEFRGICASEGFAMGPLFRLRHTRPALGRRVGDARYEQALYEAACAIAVGELAALETRANGDDATIFSVQRLMLEDCGLISEILDYIKAGAGAAAAVERAAGIFAGRLRALGDGYLSERSTDVLDACQRVVDVLDGGERSLQRLKVPSILVSEDVYPTDIVALDRRLLLGVVTARGAVSAHAAIIARSMGIPFVVMAGDALLAACNGQSAALDGVAATIYLSPDEVTKARFAQRRNMAYRYSQTLDMLRGTPCRTRDGVHIQLFANCFSVEDVALAVSMGAEGIGLLRSEFSLLSGAREMDELSQYQFYMRCLFIAEKRPVYVSACDFGVTNDPPDAADEAELNPALGLRGVRYALAHKDFFAQQLMALLRAAQHGSLHLVLPMVTAPSEVKAVRVELEKAKEALLLRGEPFGDSLPLGVMIETPAAALQATALATVADFFHLGTNDLAQYTMAADRAASALQGYLHMPNAPVLRLVEMTIAAAQAANIPLCVCGENAADPSFTLELIRRGAGTFSVGPRQLAELKAELLECTVRLD